MRTTLPIGTLPGPSGPVAEPAPAETIPDSLRRYLAAVEAGQPTRLPVPPLERPRLLPALGTTRNDWPAYRGRR